MRSGWQGKSEETWLTPINFSLCLSARLHLLPPTEHQSLPKIRCWQGKTSQPTWIQELEKYFSPISPILDWKYVSVYVGCSELYEMMMTWRDGRGREREEALSTPLWLSEITRTKVEWREQSSNFNQSIYDWIWVFFVIRWSLPTGRTLAG